jgi:hypothetical protein
MDTVRVKRIIKHPDWKYDSEKGWHGYDLALIELERPAKFSPKRFNNITPPDGARLGTFGFGNTYYQSGAPEYNQGVVLNFNARATSKASRREIILASKQGKATCHGDSGGPLIYNGTLIATTTFTRGKCAPGQLMGFTRVDMRWIQKYLK